MDRRRFSFIAHTHHDACCPISPAKMDEVIALLALRAGSHLVDIGAGKGEWLFRAVKKHAVRAVAIEPAPLFADVIRERARRQEIDSIVTIVEKDAEPELAKSGPGAFDAALCIGATHALTNHQHALATMKTIVRQGGYIVVGEAYWKRTPPEPYLAFMGASESDHTSHAGNIELGLSQGLRPLHACTATDDEWDSYEWRYSRAIEEFAKANPDDPEMPAMLTRSRAWRDAYIKWGRDTLGFGVYVYENA